MKRKFIVKTAITLAITAIFVLTPAIAMASTAVAAPPVERTKAWDGIVHTLGGVPENVRKIEYRGSIFYLAPNVTDDDFQTVLKAGPETVRLKPPRDNGKLYAHPVYILWSSDKTTLLVHPIIFGFDDILDAVAIPAIAPTVKQTPSATAATAAAKPDILSAEYVRAVRAEFYRLVNEHRAEHGLRALSVNTELERYADIRAEELRTRFSHTRPNGRPAGSGWHNSRNHIGTRYAENILRPGAIGQDPISTAEGIFNIWKNSPGHNRHMLFDFRPNITMALGIVPRTDANGIVTTGAVFSTGF